ncbi:MAG: 4-alpha-glucanotransferase [Leptospiraceae bacterium]|nr:4-alpha-glucanotransferase [Leptospiraceae bacterium]
MDKALRDKLLIKRAGVSFPLVSLFTEKSYGCGDIYSLHVLYHWAIESGVSILQILPLNDLGYGRSPYSSVSAFAIDPVYISLHLLGLAEYKNQIPNSSLNIKKVKEEKIQFLKSHFKKRYDLQLIKKLEDFANKFSWLRPYAAFKILYEKNEGFHWSKWKEGKKHTSELEAKTIRENISDAHFQYWLQMVAFDQLKNEKDKMESVGVYLKGDMPILTSDNSADVWQKSNLFNRELTSGAPPDYFNAEGQNWGFPVINWDEMKRTNNSWWKERLNFLENFYHFYRIDHVLGMYRIWSIPIGAESAKKGYFHPQVGVSRKEFNLAKLIPEDFIELDLIYEFKEDRYIFYWDFFKMEGYEKLPEEIKARFFPLSELHLKDEEAHWKKNGEIILDFMVENSRMIPCAEDLGAVPAFVRDSIHEKQLIGLDIIRWTRSFEDGSYIPPDKYRANAVSALSVHDTSTALGWWKEASDDDRRAFYSLLLKIEKEKLKEEIPVGKPETTDEKSKDEPDISELIKELKETEIAEKLLDFGLSANSLYSIHMLQDYILEGKLSEAIGEFSSLLKDPDKHRINVPGTPEDENWGYCFPFHAEKLLEERNLNHKIHSLIKKNKR